MRFYLVIISCLFAFVLSGQTSYKEQVELGEVHWLRNYAEALQQAKKLNKPIFILFQEVPGCATCQNYGKNVLSDPMIVEAIENEFVPLAIFNNIKGEDSRVLEQYGEPSWNNPVVRIVDAAGSDLLSRLAGNYDRAALLLQMSLALRKHGSGSPKYIELHRAALSSQTTETAYYKMYCFWSGESHLGAADGVLATDPGWMAGSEVVKVIYDSEVVTKKTLDQYAARAKCVAVEEDKDYRSDKDLQYYLKNSPYRFLPLTVYQRTKINAALASKEDPTEFLSPRQLELFRSGTNKRSIYTLPFEEAWNLVF